MSALNAQTINSYIDIDFNDCQIQDSGVQNIDLLTGGSPECGCGLDGEALYFNGITDYLSVDKDLSSIFNQDFTISFYLQINNTIGTTDILSLQNECKRDSSFTLRYIPSINECRLDLVKNLSRSTQINFKLDESHCWQHIVIIRDGFDYLVYLNGRLAGSDSAITDYVFSPSARLAVANGPCIGISDERLSGAIESFKVYNSALNDIEIQTLDLNADMIINSDTTLLLGESLQIKMGPTCSDNFYWQNIADLNDPGSLEPIITPGQSGVYTVFFQNGNCLSYDSINLFIQNPTDLNCDQLLLPNAFTPNGDMLNETFGISNKFIVDELKSFEIYSRLGNRVFSGNDKHSSWDGIYQGKKLNPGKFAYAISYVCNGQDYQKQGIVNLIR